MVGRIYKPMPRLEHLTVRGFKSIRALEDFELRSLNILIGANGTGKSNLLALFNMLSHLSRKRLQFFIKNEGGPDALLFGGRRRTSKLEAGLSFENGSCRYQFSLEPAAEAMAFASEELSPGVADGANPAASPTASGGAAWAGGYGESRVADISHGKFASYVLPHMQLWRVFHFQDMSSMAQVRLLSDIRDNLRLRPDAGNLAPMLRHLRKRYPDNYRRIVEAVRLAVPFFGDFVHRDNVGEQTNLEWSESGGDPEKPLGPLQFSEGTLRFICLATLLHEPENLQPDLILIDEPELGLNPYSLTLLAEMLKQATDSRQIIVSTQSADLVSQFAPEDVVVASRRKDESVFERPDPDRLSAWLEDYPLGDLWRMNVLGGRPRAMKKRLLNPAPESENALPIKGSSG